MLLKKDFHDSSDCLNHPNILKNDDEDKSFFQSPWQTIALICYYKNPKEYAKIILMEIEKTNRMNALFEFYAALLTDKQMNYIELYYADDYSLAEIAEEFGVSRQAVYDNIKRTEKVLETYEMKLHMYSDYIVRSEIFDDIAERYAGDEYLQEKIAILSSIDNKE